MSVDDIQFILADLRSESFRTSDHGQERMFERGVTVEDIAEVGRTYISHVVQQNGNYKINGLDLDGDDLTVVAAYDGDTVIVTVL